MVQLEDRHTGWSNNCVDYLKSSIKNVNKTLEKDKTVLNNYGDWYIPYSSSSRPDLDINEQLGEELANIFKQLIGVWIWSIELGRIFFCRGKLFV